jgi:hypothetical protein
MKIYYRSVLSFVLFGLLSTFSFSQDSLRVMDYNLLMYGNTTTFCTSNNNNINDKDGYLKTIVDHIRPDVLGVNEMASNAIYGSRILANVLNTDSIDYYKKATYSNQSVSSLVNMLFYNSRKLELYTELVVPTNVRDINIYTFFYKDVALSSGADTIFITFVVAHLKAGSTTSDQQSRQTMVQAAMGKLKTNSLWGNVLFMGDFNVRSSSEAAYQTLVNEGNPLYKFFDPVNQPGNWNNNSNFADLHTQSTHTSGGCPAGGGMDDRLDQILSTTFILGDSLGMNYIDGSYWAVGQDGNRFNGSLISPTNNSAPSNVIQALYNMSDHLPVIMDIEVDAQYINGMDNRTVNDGCKLEIIGSTISIEGRKGAEIRVYDQLGRILVSDDLKGGTYDLGKYLGSNRGLYFVRIASHESGCTLGHKFLIR